MNNSVNVAGIIASRSTNYTLTFPTGFNRSFDIPISQLISCKAKGEITHFFLSSNTRKEIKVSLPIKECELTLSKYAFFRVHRTYLINLSYLQSIDIESSINNLLMTDGKRIPLARRRKKEFLDYLDATGYLPFIGYQKR